MKYIASLPKPFFMMAPMDDVTDTVFRQIVSSCSPPDLFMTEFTNVDGLQSPGRPKVQTKLLHPDKDQPLIAQIWGLNPENFRQSAEQIVKGEYGHFVGIDLNMGCPVKTVIRHGACCALMNNRELAEEIIQATKQGLNGKLPLSIKTRLGYKDIDYSWHEFLLRQGIDMLIVHGRTKTQMSKVPVDWSAINEIRKLRDKLAPETLIVGNGDINSRAEGKEIAKKYKLDGVMIGRGIFNDPYVFSVNSKWMECSKEQKISLFTDHIKLFASTWNGSNPTQILNKFCKIYINNFDGAKEMREILMAAKSTDQLLELLAQA